MPENNEQNFDEPNQQNPNEERALGAAAGAPFQTEAQEMKAQRGGEQEDQLAGETPRGAHNQSRENRNPTGDDAGARGQGDDNF